MAVSSVLVSVVGGIFGWVFFLMTLGILKGFICNGVSIAISEFLMKCNDNEIREKIARWLSNGDDILAFLKDIDKKIGKS